ncbi:MAG: nucleoside/nucleotide kinase family protein [Planctomycetota bacterium]
MVSEGGIVLDQAGIAGLAVSLQRRVKALPAGARVVVLIAGIPGSGKSTLTSAVYRQLVAASPGYAAIAGMDGFHRPEAELVREGLLERKGAVETFDRHGYVELVRRVASPNWTGQLPTYEHAAREPVYSGKPEHRVGKGCRVILAEGNYLLLEMQPWAALRGIAVQSWWVDTPWARAEAWLRPRHAASGHPPVVVEQKIANDRRNAQLIEQRSVHADVVVRWPAA